MKKFLSLVASIATGLSLAGAASAQLVSDPNTIQSLTNTMAGEATLGSVSVGYLVATIIRVILSLLAIIFLVLTIAAGFRWMTAGGNEEQVKKSTGALRDAVIGLVIVLAAYTITYFLFKYLPFGLGGGGSTTSSG